jgi:DNA-binding MarR family transcriptional regulator
MTSTTLSSKETHNLPPTRLAESNPRHLSVRTWLRLYACSNLIEQQIQQKLRTQYGTTLARFDFLAQLVRQPEGLKMNVLSKKLMVSGGNITGLTDQLVKEGLVIRKDDPHDRRSYLLICTDEGKKEFAEMAKSHEIWVSEIMQDLGMQEIEQLYASLDHLKNLLTSQ